jgi:hypothetical protein
MKTLKPMILAVAATLSLSAFAQSDTVVEQINVTSDAVKVALEEFSQGRFQEEDSLDATKKKATFNAEATKALTAFEEAVRIRVLKSFTVLVNQYNAAYKNRSLGSARGDVMKNIREQLETLANDKSGVYRQAYLELYKVLPDMPIVHGLGENGYSYTDSHKSNPLCIESMANCDYTYTYNNEVYFARSGTKKVSFSSDRHDIQGLKLLEKGFGIKKDDYKARILDNCYTATCFYVTQNMYTIWKSMVEVSLTRDIHITLDDGSNLTITKNAKRQVVVLDDLLNNMKTEGVVNNLPYQVSEKRLAVLEQMNDNIAKGSCGKAKKAAADLCSTTEEGCLQASEVALFKDRFGSKASCLK